MIEAISVLLLVFGVLILSAVAGLILFLVWCAWKNRGRKWCALDSLPSERRRMAHRADEARAAAFAAGSWEKYEAHFHGPPPAALKAFYATDDVLAVDFACAETEASLRHYIANFILPEDGIEGDHFVFAEDGMGNSFRIVPGEADGRLPVYFYDHESDGTEPIAPELESFLGWKRYGYERTGRK